MSENITCDLISRQAAIDKFEPWLKVQGSSEGELNMLKAVLYELQFLPGATDTNVGGMISRQAAIDEFYSRADDDGYVCYSAEDMEGIIRTFPSAQPERKKGKWIQKEDPYGFFDTIPVCSECGHTTKMRETYNFCPNCGADMRGEQDEDN